MQSAYYMPQTIWLKAQRKNTDIKNGLFSSNLMIINHELWAKIHGSLKNWNTKHSDEVSFQVESRDGKKFKPGWRAAPVMVKHIIKNIPSIQYYVTVGGKIIFWYCIPVDWMLLNNNTQRIGSYNKLPRAIHNSNVAL